MIDSVLRLMGRGRTDAEGLDVFSGLLLSSTPMRLLDGSDSAVLAGFAQQAFQHLQRKPHKRHSIALATSGLLSGAGQPLALLQILNDDMPFVVESVVSELHAQGLAPRLVLHPTFKVKRYGSGLLQAVVGAGDRHWAAGDQESYIAVLLDPLDEEARTRLVQGLEAVLDDVRAAAVDGDAMRARLAQAISTYGAMQLGLEPPPGAPAPLQLREAVELLRWLGEGNFTLLGIRDYELVGLDGQSDLWPMASGALGIGRADALAGTRGEVVAGMTPGIRAIYESPSPLIFSKSSIRSRVRRAVPLDCIGMKRYTPAGKLIGELRLFGLFTPAAFMQPVEAVPVVRDKVRRVLADAGFPPESHNCRALLDILENFPRDELLQIDPERLRDWSLKLIDLSFRPRVAVLTRRDDLGHYISALVFVPRDHYSSAVRERIGAFLTARLGGEVAAFYPYFTASPLVRTHLIVTGGGEGVAVDDEELEARVAEIIKTWDERLAEALARSAGKVRDAKAADAYRGAFSAGYTERFPVERAVEDIARIERLGPETPVAIDYYRAPGDPDCRVRAALYRFDRPIALSERVPLLENMGFRVIDERSYRVRPRLAGVERDVVLHDMVLETTDGGGIELVRHELRMEEAFLAVFRGDAENDLFNALVIAAGLDWREAAILRALAAYMRQMRAPFGPRYIAETLVSYPSIAIDLYQLFKNRFAEPGIIAADVREATEALVRQRIETALAGVQGLDEDRILRRLSGLVLAIVRTNAFQPGPAGAPPATIAFKLAPREIDRLPEPKPYREIFVYSPRVEGVHLRFAPIARGGIRWSDRAQDYRTEILGLAKAQQVKNTVILPSGAKGGFVPKSMKRGATREEVQAEGIACYRLFIEAMLSVTDDIRDGVVMPPASLERRDGDDPYLVVAADKGTATFSDDANAISLARGFWLGDAFASGGSAGYDHKRMGITARGAWECVKRHFREIDIDIQTQPFTVVGVGDMSGDVFGNAMLLSPVIRLVAAFDHRDIFLDPVPDPVAGFAERKRLFELPRSSWADYDRAKLSAGGGVFSRTLKSIPLSREVALLLGVDATELTPSELMQAILRCQTDLLWFGGIGTFVRETGESDEQAGDRANDASRIPACELRAKVIGEGANLGVTQRGRIEAAIRGIRLNTDFIDNSAGVNTSDKEVNIKIALEPALAAGRLSRENRNRLLASMAPAVAASVLANNHAQSLALSLAERASAREMKHIAGLVRHLEARGLVDRKLEALPTGAELSARAAAGKGLTRPELAVLLSWSKIAINADLLASTLPDGAHADRLVAYFPPELRDDWRGEIESHRLRREIVATALTNTIVNVGGPAVLVRLAAEAAIDLVGNASMLAEIYLAARTIHGIDTDWVNVDALDGKVPGGVQLELYEGLAELAAHETLRLLRERGGRATAEMIATYAPAAREIGAGLAGLLPPMRRAAVAAAARALQDKGVPEAVAARHAALPIVGQIMALADRTHGTGTGAGVGETARVLFATAEHLRLDELRGRAAAIQPTDEFERQLVSASMAIVERAARVVGDTMLADPASRGQPLDDWAAKQAPALAAARPVLDKALAEPGLSAARLAIVAEALRGLAGAAA